MTFGSDFAVKTLAITKAKAVLEAYAFKPGGTEVYRVGFAMAKQDRIYLCCAGPVSVRFIRFILGLWEPNPKTPLPCRSTARCVEAERPPKQEPDAAEDAASVPDH